MKYWRSAALIVLAVLFVAASSCSSDKTGTAANFALKTADGKTIELKKLAGKVVVVNFWATWCGPCRAEIPGMQEVYNKYKSKGLEIVGISVDQGGWRDVSPYVQKSNITYPIVLADETVADAYGGINAIPTSFIVNREGKIVTHHVGYFDKAEFEKAIKAVL